MNKNPMRAIIIGAGRGQRLMPSTADQPKCFARVRDRRILDWIVSALRANGIDDICFVGGYRIEKVKKAYPEFTFRENADWPNNNIMESLMCARDLMDREFVSCYSDTLITADLVRTLAKTAARNDRGIHLSVDTDWESRYAHRSEHPPDDAEKILSDNGRVTRVHRGIEVALAHGEYTGVTWFSQSGARDLQNHYERCKAAFAGKPFREASVFEKAYLIHLLQQMIEDGVEIGHSDFPGGYMEIDTQQDFELAQTGWETG